MLAVKIRIRIGDSTGSIGARRWRLERLSSKNSTACKSGINESCGSFANGSGVENLEIKGRLSLKNVVEFWAGAFLVKIAQSYPIMQCDK